VTFVTEVTVHKILTFTPAKPDAPILNRPSSYPPNPGDFEVLRPVLFCFDMIKLTKQKSNTLRSSFQQLRPVHPISGFQRFSFQRFPPIQAPSSQIKLWPPDATM
jgi:hypothetical protein